MKEQIFRASCQKLNVVLSACSRNMIECLQLFNVLPLETLSSFDPFELTKSIAVAYGNECTYEVANFFRVVLHKFVILN